MEEIKGLNNIITSQYKEIIELNVPDKSDDNYRKLSLMNAEINSNGKNMFLLKEIDLGVCKISIVLIITYKGNRLLDIYDSNWIKEVK